ncbi:tyrosine-type recombinase/integrase [Gimesia aquarii]|uniref:tyrosine-type recombinase/integrase n=1 Tax=Gimesia aquarii TaxID=2527964 RepID=UPI0011A56652|nr:tyrosine-type recombinase/integrase [Gimesia aquarii]
MQRNSVSRKTVFTHCWRPKEVEVILKDSEATTLIWLRSAVLALSTTGLGISELADLHWSDIDLNRGMITLSDESTSRPQSSREWRSTKSGYSRLFLSHADLRNVLETLTHTTDGRRHSLRHYFCSVCANAGIAERILRSGLDTGEKLVHRYYHLADGESQ